MRSFVHKQNLQKYVPEGETNPSKQHEAFQSDVDFKAIW